ncbi:glycoside hydrolase family 15 protein [Micromonospora yangpuensis]|uniref:Glucoamylase (Glucan-1,4-alpha-glucosidase), GH15 family n=1 Tax=Micromonospora yangpuensis TaxID=683228 RepID=A0A1C6UN85_9ACTN|nr:glycoside hydrolase family 15 protein [Micromonospora yangpuensis]GGM09466.1 glucoamylase [Micromonospora yangpuensis]SCL55486.1 Glucoamylase (glucan-1,4-alpha-glucosidase), GH15 family [Micromonospora yangpuensis]
MTVSGADQGFPPIDGYAFLSDTHTAALIAPDGSVEWFCAPRFDGDAVFARLLDRDVGGFFSLTVEGAGPPRRCYLPDTLVLESRYAGTDGTAVVRDFLAVSTGDPQQPIRAGQLLVRQVTAEGGPVRLAVRLTPRHGYGAHPVRWRHTDGRWRASDTPLWFTADLPSSGDGAPAPSADGGQLRADADLAEGQTVTLLLGYGEAPAAADATAEPATAEAHADPGAAGTHTAARLLDETVRTWRDWSARSDYTGFAAEAVRHSALVLRGLSFDETGALIAAPTTSLPEEIGGVRNWDYRYTWHRDSALLLLALFRLGHAEEGRRYLRFLLDICSGQGMLAPLIGIDGGTDEEQELDHLGGYAGSRPVRIGNEAAGQVQFDTYGHILDAALAYQQLTGELTGQQWTLLRRHVDTMAQRWHEPDHGIWEIRGPRRHHVNSKVMTWVCLDRGIQLAGLLGDDDAPADRWRAARDELHAEVLARGYDHQGGGFVMWYDSTEPDASLLRIPLVGFLPADDPRVLATIDRVWQDLAIAPALIRRYRADDGLPGEEGAFLLCSFELVSALAVAGRRDEAQQLFDRLTELAGPLGLYSEQLAADGTALGNHPQAFTHLALIEAALNLDAGGDTEELHAWAERGIHAPQH